MPSTPTHHFNRTTPESQGIPSSAILQLIEALDSQMHDIHSVMLLRHGNVIAEGWWSPYQRERPHMLFSLSKSFTSTAVGLAVTEGHLSIDDPVLSFFPNEAPEVASDFLKAMCVRHLLSMSTGQATDTWPPMVTRPADNWSKAFFEVPVLHAPGTHFLYNTGATYMLSAIVQKTTGLKLIDYLQPRLFQPLGITNPTWEESPQGVSLGGIGLSITTEDIARFGQLYLQNGLWQGNRVLPEAWVEDATAFQISNGSDPNSDWAQGYGYQFWRCRHNAYRGDGAFGQYCVVLPEQDVVIAITSGVDPLEMQPPLNLIWQILLPAIQPDALPEDAAAHHRLTEKLSSLSQPPVQGGATSDISSQLSGKPYIVDANALKIETLTLGFNESGCIARFKTARGEETINCGVGTWQYGQTMLFNEPNFLTHARIASSGAWTHADTFTMIVRLHETPYVQTLVYHFAGDDMTLEVRVNVSFGSTAPVILTAR